MALAGLKLGNGQDMPGKGSLFHFRSGLFVLDFGESQTGTEFTSFLLQPRHWWAYGEVTQCLGKVLCILFSFQSDLPPGSVPDYFRVSETMSE